MAGAALNAICVRTRHEAPFELQEARRVNQELRWRISELEAQVMSPHRIVGPGRPLRTWESHAELLQEIIDMWTEKIERAVEQLLEVRDGQWPVERLTEYNGVVGALNILQDNESETSEEDEDEQGN